MTDQAVPQPGTVALEPPSTVLNPQTVSHTSGGGAPALTEPADNQSIESVLDAELARLKAEDGKDKPEAKVELDDKPKVDKDAKEAKPAKEDKLDDKAKLEKAERARAEDGKFAKAADKDAKPGEAEQKGAPEEAATGQEVSREERQSEGRKLPEAPARFLPKEKEAWANVPNVVKSAVERLAKEHETEVTQYRESHENWQKLSKFDEMAKQHKTSVADALERYTNLDGLLQSNPIEAIRQILATKGITPEQYANHVISNPDAHRAQPAPPAPDPQVRQMSSEVTQLRQEIASFKEQQATATIIEPFRTAHPRFDELQDDIAFFLESGKIPASLNPAERLEAAYDMAERINPRSTSAPSKEAEPIAASTARLVNPDAGKKSIRGAPSDGADTEVEDTDTDISKLLRKELRRMSA